MDFESINQFLEQIENDRTVPRNIRNSITEARKGLNDKSKDLLVRINLAISILDEVSNDTNIPAYTRTHVWNIMSMLEVMNEQAKKEATE